MDVGLSSQYPTYRLSVWPFGILSTSCLSDCLSSMAHPIVPRKSATHTEISQNSLLKQWTPAWDCWKETEFKALFTRVQLLCNFAPWRLLISPGSCFSMDRRGRFWFGAAVSLLCFSKRTRKSMSLRLLEAMLGGWHGFGYHSGVQAVRGNRIHSKLQL